MSPEPAFRAAAERCPPRELRVGIGPLHVAIRVAGPALADRLFTPLRHIAVAADATPADICIDAWSVGETGVDAPQEAGWTSGEPLEWLSADTSHIISCLPNAAEIQRVSIARPFQWALVPALRERELSAAHGGLICAPGAAKGLMLVGPNGSGKSTTCLAAINAGFTLVGEDYFVLENVQGRMVGHSLYCSCNLTRHTRELFPGLKGTFHLPHGAPADSKTILHLPTAAPDSPMRRQLEVGALVFPVVTGETGASRVVPVNRGEAYRRFVPALRQARKLPPAERAELHDALLPLVIERPAYRLELGREIARVPDSLLEISEQVQ